MKHLIIGDLHGKDCWKDVDINLYDKVVFLGDYVDDWTLPDLKIYQNLLEIIKLKQDNRKRIVLLLGNHDVQYLYYPDFLCSGFRPTMQKFLTSLFYGNRQLFQVAYQRKNHLFSHAGITNAWYEDFLKLPLLAQIRDSHDTVADMINKIDQTSQHGLLHQAGKTRGGYGHGGVTWADKSELENDMLNGYHQVVGHTVINEVQVVKHKHKSVTFIDVLDSETYFHEVEC
jgi:hypothetical protein